MNLRENSSDPAVSRKQRQPVAWRDDRSRGGRSLYLVIWAFLCLTLTPLATHAQTPPDKEAQLIIPPNKDGPTEVIVDVWIRDIISIDEREQVFEVDAELIAEWQDDRLAFDPDQFGDTYKVYQGEVALEKLKTEIWWPDFEITASRGPRDRMFIDLEVDYEGFVFYRERFRVFIVQPFFLEDFPFDEHFISLNVEPFSYDGDRVIFLEPEETQGTLDWETNEWYIGEVERYIVSGAPEDRAEDEYPYASATFEVRIERIPDFYFSNIILPLLLIVAISWAVFWMDFETMHLADRLSVSFTSVLTVVAFDFVTSDSLPRLPYATLLDRILTVSYIFLSLTVLENVVGHSLVKRGKPEAAQKVDRLSRWLFPIGYYLVLVLAILWGIVANAA